MIISTTLMAGALVWTLAILVMVGSVALLALLVDATIRNWRELAHKGISARVQPVPSDPECPDDYREELV